MYKTFIITLSLLFLACGSPKEVITNTNNSDETVESKDITTDSDTIQHTKETKEFNVQIKIWQHIPYCGGAAPTEDMLNRTHPVSGNFVLTNTVTNKKKTVIANGKGIIELQLKPGNYTLKETYKDVSFKEFYNQNSKITGSYTQVQDKECYKKWWSSNLNKFEIIADKPILYLESHLYSRCFTGNNPCLIYTGPYPP